MKFVEPLDVDKILNSTDLFLFDVDGVLKLGVNPIPGAIPFIKQLRLLGKKVGFVTNSTFINLDDQQKRLSFFDATYDEIFTPHNAVISYLKKIQFEKDIFVISSPTTKEVLRKFGYRILDVKDVTSTPIEVTVNALMEVSKKAIDVCSNVGAILIDVDFGFSHLSAQVALTLLKQFDDVLLLNCVLDDYGPVGNDLMLLGPAYYIDVIERQSKRKGLTLGKPAAALMDALKPAYNIIDPSRVMFFGDNVSADIAFGYNCGFQTCLVLTGHATNEDVKQWKHPEEYKPDYVADSIAALVLN